MTFQSLNWTLFIHCYSGELDARVNTNVTFPTKEIFGPELDFSIRSIQTQLIRAQTHPIQKRYTGVLEQKTMDLSMVSVKLEVRGKAPPKVINWARSKESWVGVWGGEEGLSNKAQPKLINWVRSNETWVTEGVRDEAQPKMIERARSKELWIGWG